MLSTLIASTLIDRCGSAALRSAILPDLADGATTSAVGLEAGGLVATRCPSGYRVDGRVGAVLDAPGAELLVLPARLADAPGPGMAGGPSDLFVWLVLDAATADVAPDPRIDLTRTVGSVHLADAVVPDERVLAGLTVAAARAVAATLVGAECVGGTRWCVETAAEYAQTRHQFGRPIGQFQAVKHRCADLLVGLHQAEADVWDAARELDNPDSHRLASTVAGATSPATFVQAAEGCIQVLGGLGFTWEHDAHLFLRRALALRRVLGGTHPWRCEAARLARHGARPHLDVQVPETGDGRADVAAFLASVRDLDPVAGRVRLAEAGYLMPHWPRPWGRDASPVEQLVIDDEFQRAGVRRPDLLVGAWALPTLIEHGTEEQQQRWVPPSLRGELAWCQLFSEPDAGSDLASLTTTATRTEDGWRLRGQKVWTSLADRADFGICLARTNPHAPKHDGITCFIVDMHAPGVEIYPLAELTGRPSFNAVFLSDVFVPDEAVIGQVDHGWRVARTTLDRERVSMASGSPLGHGLDALLGLVDQHGLDDDGWVLDRVGALVADAHALAILGLRTTLRALAGSDTGPEGSIRKLAQAEHEQRVEAFGLELLDQAAADGPTAGRSWVEGYLMKRCLTIAGGTSEIQRNILAERLLALPRDPEPSPSSADG